VLYFVSLVIVFFISITLDLACGPEPDPYDYSVSFFHNNVVDDNTYRAFYFTSGHVLYDVDEPANEEDVNSREWASYLGGKVRSADVKRAMYHLNKKTDSVLLNGYLNLKNQIPDSLKNNTFLHALRNNKAALLYYRFTKIIEPGVQPVGSWHNSPLDSNYLFKSAHYAEKEAKSAKSKFLRIRYYYQSQRLLHYTGHIKEAAEIYDKYIVNHYSGYYIKGLTDELRAGEEWRLGNNIKAANLFLRIFTNFHERRVQAYQNYVWIKAPEKDLIALAKNNDEKAVIYAIGGFGNPRLSIQSLRKVYDVQPSSPLVETLLIREINKLEGAYVSPRLTDKLPFNNVNGDYYGWNDYLKKGTNIKLHIKELENFCSQLAEENKCKHPEIGLIAKAYLEWMTGRTQEGFASVEKIKGDDLTAKLYDQKQMISLLLVSQKIKKLDTANERELVPYLNWLNKKVTQELNTKGEPTAYVNERLLRFTWSARDFYQKLLTPMYLKQHDTTKAALAMLKGMPKLVGDTLRCYHQDVWEDFTTVNFWQNYLHSSNLKKIISYEKKGNRDPYMNILTSGLKNISSDCLYDLLGTAYLREHNYKKAIIALKTIKKHSDRDFPLADYDGPRLKSNPFAEQLNDYPKNYHPTKSEIYSKLRFAKKMYELQQKAKQDPVNASKYYYTMATGLYNTSFPGNAWFLITYTWSNTWVEEGPPLNIYYKQDLIGAVTAEKYYLKARQLSNDPELKAKCTFMAAKCKQQHYNGVDDEFSNYKFFQKHSPDFQKQILHESYFEELKKYYSKTLFYRRAVNECSYLSDFLVSGNTEPHQIKKRVIVH